MTNGNFEPHTLELRNCGIPIFPHTPVGISRCFKFKIDQESPTSPQKKPLVVGEFNSHDPVIPVLVAYDLA
jgi:hypothetical protein